MKTYDLPIQLDSEINKLEELLLKFKKGEISATELKAHRVPFGVYEQRESDTYMVRIRCAGGMISPEQLEKISKLAQAFDIKAIHITTRQEIQLHYVKLNDIVLIIRQLKDIGLTTRGGGGNTIRNIVAQEDAGIDPGEKFDVTPYTIALTSRLISETDSWNLPRKFKIAFSGSDEDKGYATISDIGFIARIKNGVKGFKVYAAGGLGAKSEMSKLLIDFVRADEIYPVARALKNIFYKYGNRKNKHTARLRFLWNNIGEEEFKRRFQEEYAKIKEQGFPALDIDDSPVGSAPLDLSQEEPGNMQDFNLWKKRFVRPQKQKEMFSILIPIELGFISCEHSLMLGRFLKAFGEDVIRMTRDQNFLLRNIPGQYLGNIYNFLKDSLPDFNRPSIFGKILSCAGASTCQLGICLSRQAAKALMNILAKNNLDLDKLSDVKLNISGCPNSCGQHSVADLGFSGKALRKDGVLYPAYSVFAGAVIHSGATTLAEHFGEIPAKNLPKLVKELFEIYLSKSGNFSDFRSYIRQKGKEDLKKLYLLYKEIPSFDEDKNYYYDWGGTKQFSLAERRTGECSAGLFDLLEMDFGNIRETIKTLSQNHDDNAKAELIRKLVFYSSRALLITRGIEPKNEEEVYEAFLQNFVDTALIGAAFRDIIALARRKDYTALLSNERTAYNLARSVQELYENMDNVFNFNVGTGQCPVPTSISGVLALVKDLRGVGCPMNFVKTKVELAKLKPGDILEVWLDDGEPIENVPGSIKAEGHTIISQKRIANYWSVIIKKK